MKKSLTAMLVTALISAVLVLPASAYGNNTNVRDMNNNNTTGGNYSTNKVRAHAVNGNNNGSNWGWLGLIGLLGLAGMRRRETDRS
ncbi:WGxxGxxG family protein [Paenibacillus sp. FSL R5-0407]|uniref:WGxxGxxG family protein n=1 Tax=Paenibacillus sp. FSL R5-0407 TaxID=2975320 RepID=UPI0030FB2412